MAVDITDLIDSLKAEINPPGIEIFTEANDTDYEERLRSAFWELRMFGLSGMASFTESDGIVTENIATPVNDLGREYQQLIVLLAAYKILTVYAGVSLNTSLRAHAGSVEYETNRPAAAIDGMIKSIEGRFYRIMSDLDQEQTVSTYYIDSITERGLNYYPDSTFTGY